MGTELSPQQVADLTNDLHSWAERWSVDPRDLERFMVEADVVARFNSIVGDDHSTVTTSIPAAARKELTALIAAAMRGAPSE